MKKDTYANKLAELLGLGEVKKEHDKKKKEKPGFGKFEGITEEEIQVWREKQGVTYFLQAPALFQAKVCAHCGASYLVSRLYVAYCSYTCIDKALEADGINWNRRGDYEAIIKEVYEGNEPLWIRNLDSLKLALSKLIELEGTLTSQYLPTSEELSPSAPVS